MMSSGKDSGSSLDSGLTGELYTTALPEQLEPQPQLTEEDIQELAKWMEELWLTEEELREQFSEADWLEFIETVRETPIY